MQAAFIRAHRSQQVAAEDTLEFEDKFRALIEHANKTIDFIGVDTFESRFTADNSSSSMRDRMAKCVSDYNKTAATISTRRTTEHVASFKAGKSSHNNAAASGSQFPALPPYSSTLMTPATPRAPETPKNPAATEPSAPRSRRAATASPQNAIASSSKQAPA